MDRHVVHLSPAAHRNRTVSGPSMRIPIAAALLAALALATHTPRCTGAGPGAGGTEQRRAAGLPRLRPALRFRLHPPGNHVHQLGRRPARRPDPRARHRPAHGLRHRVPAGVHRSRGVRGSGSDPPPRQQPNGHRRRAPPRVRAHPAVGDGAIHRTDGDGRVRRPGRRNPGRHRGVHGDDGPRH